MAKILYLSNDNVLTLDELTNIVDGTYINSATVTATVKDSTGTEVSGETWPITLDYVAASNGKYQAVLEDGLVLTNGASYDVEVDIDAGADKIAHMVLTVKGRTRKA